MRDATHPGTRMAIALQACPESLLREQTLRAQRIRVVGAHAVAEMIHGGLKCRVGLPKIARLTQNTAQREVSQAGVAREGFAALQTLRDLQRLARIRLCESLFALLRSGA